MSILDVFSGDAFTYVSLCAAVDRMGYVPGLLTGMPGLVVPRPVRTTEVWVEERDFMPALVQTSPRGAPPPERSGDRRKARPFQTVRIADKSRINASELLGIREFGQEQAMKSAQSEVDRRNFKMKQDFALTKENMLLGAVQGLVVDADGSTINDWAAEFSQTIPAEVTWTFPSTADGTILQHCNQTRRGIARALRGLGGNVVEVHALAGDEWWDTFVTSAEVRQTYQYAMQALQLQNNVGGAWESFRYGKIIFHNYRSSDDGKIGVPSNKVKFFPVGAGIFVRADAPGESFTDIGNVGQESYSRIVPDRERDAWVDVEQYSYPLFVCTMPQALARGTL